MPAAMVARGAHHKRTIVPGERCFTTDKVVAVTLRPLFFVRSGSKDKPVAEKINLDGKLVLAGAGKMGGAMLEGWLAGGLSANDVIVQDPSPPPEIVSLLEKHGVKHVEKLTETTLDAPPAVILMAVKPQIMDDVFPAVAPLAGPDTVTLSIAAGKTVASFEKHLASSRAVVRTIPNTPAAVGRGITVCFGNAHATDKHREVCTGLLSAIGEVGWVDNEDLIDVSTAVSGSGPAYVFLLAECLAKAGVAAGLDEALAARLAEATVAGSGELMRQSDLPPSTLRENVTSPNGTTYAALQVLMAESDGFGPLMQRAVDAATKRSRELAG
ncbi:MAG: pyrroline-5-carboxylate reductase [Alphaproteobacteria bacterium]|jgi:pyrroline-5-carboxylate reductase